MCLSKASICPIKFRPSFLFKPSHQSEAKINQPLPTRIHTTSADSLFLELER
jgi:hypothetical protein